MPEVQLRPDPEPAGEDARWLLSRVPGATWDSGLARATNTLAMAAIDRGSRLTPRATAAALAEAGYPGPAIFLREYNGGARPAFLAEQLAQVALSRSQPVDISLSRRDYGDDTTLWLAGIAHRPVSLDPIPRDLALDQPLPIRVNLPDGFASDELALFVAPPHAPVERHLLSDGVALWLDSFHVPGTYRLEVVSSTEDSAQVLLLWSHFVDRSPPELAPLPRAEASPPDPAAATESLYAALAELRAGAGLPPLARFAPFEPLAREHAALMATHNVVDHRIDGITPGVAVRARSQFHPKALHREDVAAAANWQEAMDLLTLSPGHLQNLLCTDCTHVAIGAALEPVTADRTPRLFAVWELLEFPNGTPRPIDHFER